MNHLRIIVTFFLLIFTVFAILIIMMTILTILKLTKLKNMIFKTNSKIQEKMKIMTFTNLL